VKEKWGSSGNGDGQFSSPTGVVVDSSGSVYVADSGNNRIQKFTSNGTFITKMGSFGWADGSFQLSEGIALILKLSMFM
jgi:tripartite motif-containing protein 71